MKAGLLSIVGTPIGNLADITLRALDTLRAADLVLAEDTRRTRALLTHYGIKARLESFHSHNRGERIPRVLEELASGRRVALVSDAGMPGISDPGSDLVAAAGGQGTAVEVVPGPTAAAAAVAVSGLPVTRFHFEGFLPARRGPRRERLRELAALADALVFYEAPHRVRETLADLCEVLGAARGVAVCRELTKLHEETVRGTLGEVSAALAAVEPRGEFTIVCRGWSEEDEAPPSVPSDRLEREFAYLTGPEGLSRRDAVRELAERHRLPRRLIYRLFS